MANSRTCRGDTRGNHTMLSHFQRTCKSPGSSLAETEQPPERIPRASADLLLSMWCTMWCTLLAHWFPVAGPTNDHKRGGSKQQRLFSHRGQKSKGSFAGLGSRHGGAMLPPEVPGRGPLPTSPSSWGLQACLISPVSASVIMGPPLLLWM